MTESTGKILVWDAPLRVFHWLLALSFAGAYLTAESERWRLVHVSLGYTLGGLLVFRVGWGLIGTRYARFGSFVRGPSAVLRYLRTLLAGRAEHHVGHNPAGAVAIVLLLLLGGIMVGTGWANYNEVGGKVLEAMHEGAANFMLALVGVHLAGVVVSSWLHRENLVRAMVNGKKAGAPGAGIQRAWRPLALAMLVAVLGFWWLQWQNAPPGPAASASSSLSKNAKYSAPVSDDD